MMRIVLDTESSGLDPTDTLHCVVAKDIDTGKTYSFYEGERLCNNSFPLSRVRDLLKKCGVMIGHNIVSHDIPLLSFWFKDVDFSFKLIDTLIWSKTLYPDRPLSRNCPVSVVGLDGYKKPVGRHSLFAWGYRTKIIKPEHNDWSVFSKEMLIRCQTDVEINHKVYEMLLKESEIDDGSDFVHSF